MTAAITITGVDELIAKLGKVQGNAVLRDPMERAVDRLQLGMKRYPPKPVGSKYRRGQDPLSEDLGSNWVTKVTSTANGLTGKIGNDTTYGPWVQSHQFQARHMSHWKEHTDLYMIDKNRPAIIADFERAIAKALK